MTTVDDVYGGKFLNAVLVKSERLVGRPLTISNVEVQEIGRAENQKTKLVLSFKEIEKELVLNKTNAGILAEVYGRDYTQWNNKRIFLHITKRQYQGQLMDAVGVSCDTAAS